MPEGSRQHREEPSTSAKVPGARSADDSVEHSSGQKRVPASRCEIVFSFPKRPAGTPYYPNNANHLAACALIERILAIPGQVLSWTGGRKDETCIAEGLDTRVVAVFESSLESEGPCADGTLNEGGRRLAKDLVEGLDAEFKISESRREAT